MVKAVRAAQNISVSHLFNVSQGVQTGFRSVFLLKETIYNSLPVKERRFFRKALMTDSITDGRIVKTYHLFFPHRKEGSLFEDEGALAKSVPTYYREFLKPNESKLRGRASIVRSKRADWWGLMHPRFFSFDYTPRIISKFFGEAGSFVCDLEGEYLPCTGHVWIPKVESILADENEEVQNEVVCHVLLAYTALLNSRIFARLVSLRSNMVAGGQFDLSSRFVSDLDVPNLWEKACDPFLAKYVRELSRVTAGRLEGVYDQVESVERVVAQLYGVPQLAEE